MNKRRSLLLSSVKGKESATDICLPLLEDGLEHEGEECPNSRPLGRLRGCRESAPGEAVALCIIS